MTLFILLGTHETTETVIYTAVWQGLGNARPFLCDKYRNVVYPHFGRISDGDCAWLGLAPGICRVSLLDNGFLCISTLSLPALYVSERIGNAKNSFYLGF